MSAKSRLRGLLKREIKVSGAVLATAALLLLIATASHTCAAGACDTEDFYPSEYIHSKWSYTLPSGQKIDVIVTRNLWTKNLSISEVAFTSPLTSIEL
jgi:hypothetical protein